MSQGHYTPAGFVIGSTGVPAQAQLDDNGNLKVNVVTGGGGTTADTTANGSIGALNDAVTLTLDGMSTVGIDLHTSSPFVGILTFQSTVDGLSWVSHACEAQSDSNFTTGLQNLAPPTHLLFKGAIAGRSAFRVICTSYTSGFVTGINLRASAGAIEFNAVAANVAEIVLDLDTVATWVTNGAPVQGANFDGITGVTPLLPVTIGGHYASTQPTYSDDAVTSFASTIRGALIVAPGAEGFSVTPVRYTTEFDFTGDSLVYFGQALPGSSTGSAVWQIRKFTYDGSNNLASMVYADGESAFTKTWTSRAGYSYS
jgi:hypothetical protein